MKQPARILSYLSLLAAWLSRLHPQSGMAAILLLPCKLWSGALAPFTAIAGVLGALLSLLCRDWLAALAGLLGASAAAHHLRAVTAPHDGFTRAFGPDWEARLPPQITARVVAHRWTLPMAHRQPPAITPQCDVVCGLADGGEPLLCDIWEPPGDVPRTGLAVIYLHGSGWHYGYKNMLTRPFFRRLAGQGHVVMDVAYTLAPKAALHGQIGDVKRAIIWMKAHAAEYGVDPTRVVLMGGSAGGHLALLAAYTPNHSELDPANVNAGTDIDTSVRGVVSYYGLPDVAALYNDWQTRFGDAFSGKTTLCKLFINTFEPLSYRSGLIPPYGRFQPPARLPIGLTGGTLESLPSVYRLASPITHVGPDCPPTLLLQGEHDFCGIAPQVRHLHWKLCEAGAKSILVEFPNSEHMFDLMPGMWAPAAQAAAYDVERFLALMV